MSQVLRAPAPRPEPETPAAAPPEEARERFLVPGEPVVFEELFVAAVRDARERVRARAPEAYALLAGAAHASLERTLLVRLAEVCVRALFAEFGVFRSARGGATRALWDADGGPPRALYRAFLRHMREGGMDAFFRAYPVAARLSETLVESWADTTAEFVLRVAADREALEGAFGGGAPLGLVARVNAGAGDTHDGGRSVFIVRFASGVRLAYKPRPIGMELVYGELAARLNAGRPTPLLPALAYVARPTHGWIEFVEAAPCASADEVRAFYVRMGGIMAVVHAMNGHDFHRENLIASGARPVLIDMETLVRHGLDTSSAADFGYLGQDAVRAAMQSSVLQTGLLPMRWLGAQHRAVDIGVLGGDESAPTPVEVPYWRLPNTDLMRLDQQPHTPAPSPCVPVLDGRRHPATEHVEAIVAGFRAAYDALADGRGALFDEALMTRLGEQPIRFIFRPTNLYGSLLQRGNHPTYLKRDEDRREMIGVLAGPLWKLGGRPGLDAILDAERHALEQMDVPCFSARAGSTTLELPDGGRVPGFFDRSAVEETRRRIAGLGEADRELQVSLVRMALDCRAAKGLEVPFPACDPPPAAAAVAGPDFARRAIAEAARIAARLERAAVRGPGEPPAWIGVGYHPLLRGHVAGALPSTLFSGSAGIALFLGAVERMAGGGRFGALARDAVEPLRALARHAAAGADADAEEPLRLHFGRHAGMAEGLAGAVYALGVLAEFLADPALAADARTLAALLTPERVHEHRSMNAFDGVAGAVLALLALERRAPDEALRRQAAACGEPLLGYPAAVAAAPEEVRRALPSGMALGPAGIALALARLHRATGELRWLEGARAALALDRSPGAAEEVDASWHGGAAGVLLAQLETAPPSEALPTVARLGAGMWASGDAPSTGALGRADALAAAAAALGSAELLEAARGVGAAVLARAEAAGGRYRLGWGEGYLHPGLFEGEAGVGYALLRLAHPDALPSVLRWD